MKFKLVLSLFFFMLSICISPSCGQKIIVDTGAIVPEQLNKNIDGEIKFKCAFSDNAGKHFFYCTREYKSDSMDNQTINLKARQFLLSGATWNAEWIIKDFVNCPVVDIDGDFYSDLISITDLDKNGTAETTVAYFLICTGGVAPKTTKAIMRQGSTKFAVRGKSLVQIDDKTSEGGKFTADQSLDQHPDIKDHLIRIWKKASDVE